MTKSQMEEKIKRLEEKAHKLEVSNAELVEGARQVSRLTDAIIAETCLKYGEVVYEDVKAPEVAKVIGYRLEILTPDVEMARRLHVEKRDGHLIIGYLLEEN